MYDTRSAQSHFTSLLVKLAALPRSYYTYCCVRSPLHDLRRSRGSDGCCHPPLAVSAFTCRRSRNLWVSRSMSMINAPRTARTAAERRELYQNRRTQIKRNGIQSSWRFSSTWIGVAVRDCAPPQFTNSTEYEMIHLSTSHNCAKLILSGNAFCTVMEAPRPSAPSRTS